MITIGILADMPTASTGFAIVNHNIAVNLVELFYPDIRVIYFARFGINKGVAPFSSAFHGYEVVNCEGGVWKASIVEELIRRYRVDVVYSEDDWFSAKGIIEGTKRCKVPFYFLTPIDSLPIQKEAHDIFKQCRKVFVPNKSYKYIENGVYLPHGVDWMTFKPARKAFDNFTFLWIGRDEKRKALGRTILAYQKALRKVDCGLVVRTNWGESPMSKKTMDYIRVKRLPIIKDRMTNCPHEHLARVYNSCHAYINSSKAGGCEMGVLEASASGLPVLVTDWTFMAENVINGKTGFLIPISGYDIQVKRTRTGKPIEGSKGRIWGNISVNKLTEKMVWLVENQEKSHKMGLNGLLRIRKYYNWRDVAEKLYNVITRDYERFIKKGENK